MACPRISCINVDPEPLDSTTVRIWRRRVHCRHRPDTKFGATDLRDARGPGWPRRLVVLYEAAGRQRQFSGTPWPCKQRPGTLRQPDREIANNPAATWSVEQMAEMAGQSTPHVSPPFSSPRRVVAIRGSQKIKCYLATRFFIPPHEPCPDRRGEQAFGSKSGCGGYVRCLWASTPLRCDSVLMTCWLPAAICSQRQQYEGRGAINASPARSQPAQPPLNRARAHDSALAEHGASFRFPGQSAVPSGQIR